MVPRRVGAILAAVALVAGGCSPNKPSRDAVPTTSSGAAATTTTAFESVVGEPIFAQSSVGSCHGTIGPAPKKGVLTWAVFDELRSADGCLVRFTGRVDTIAWGGDGDRLLVNQSLVLKEGGGVAFNLPTTGRLTWSRPKGNALLSVAGGHVAKQPLGEPMRDLGLFSAGDLAIYHPAGRSIVVAEPNVLTIADNEARDSRPIAEGENAEVTEMAFTASGALLFIAKHDDHAHLHRLEFDPSKLTTVETFDLDDVPSSLTVSPFAGGGVAYAHGGRCGSGAKPPQLWASQGGKVLPIAGTPVEHGTPAGWMPDGSLAVIVRPDGCASNPGELYRFADGKATLVAKDVRTAAVRAPQPPPPAPPKDIPSQAPS